MPQSLKSLSVLGAYSRKLQGLLLRKLRGISYRFCQAKGSWLGCDMLRAGTNDLPVSCVVVRYLRNQFLRNYIFLSGCKSRSVLKIIASIYSRDIIDLH